MSRGMARTLASTRGRTLGQRIQRTSTLLLAVHVLGALLMFAYSVVVARLLGRDGYGVFVYVENLAELLLPLALLGFPQVLVRYVAIYRSDEQWDRLRGLLRVTRVSSLAVAVVVAVVAWLGYELISAAPLGMGAWVLPVGLALLPVMALLHLDQSVLQGLRAPLAGMVPNQIIRPLVAIGGTVIVWWGARLDVVTALVALLASLVVTEALTALVTRHRLGAAVTERRGPVDTAALRQWMSMSWLLLATGVTSRLVQRVNILVIGALSSAGEVAAYGIGFQATRFIAFTVGSVGVVTGPYVATMFAKREFDKLQAVFDDAVRWVAILALPIGAAFLLLGDRVLALFGEAYEGGYPAFATLVAARLVGCLTGPTIAMLNMAGDQRWLLASLVAGAGVNVAVSVWSVPAHGALGGAIGSLGGVTLSNIVMLAVLRRKYDLRLRLRRGAAPW